MYGRRRWGGFGFYGRPISFRRPIAYGFGVPFILGTAVGATIGQNNYYQNPYYYPYY